MSRLKGLLDGISDDQLLMHLQDLIQRNRGLEAELVAHLGEIDARRLYIEQACSSMFNYCVHVLHFAEAVAPPLGPRRNVTQRPYPGMEPERSLYFLFPEREKGCVRLTAFTVGFGDVAPHFAS